MTANTLKKHGLSREDSAWLEGLGVTSLTEMQAAGLRVFEQQRRRGVFLLGPTSSGKTFLFVLASMKALSAGGKALLAVTTRSQQSEIARRYLPHFRGRGFRTFPGSPEASLKAGGFDIGVAVYEQVFSALPSLAQVMDSPDGIVALDEVDIALDRARGITAATVAKRLHRGTRAKLMLTSAVLNPEDELVSWAGLTVLHSGQRGAPLKQGIFSAGDFIYEEYNSGSRGKENIALHFPALPEQDSLRTLAREMHLRGETTLVFLRDRNSTRRQARQLAAELRETKKPSPLPDEIRNLPETFSRELLAEVVPFGVGFHNADLTSAERDAVEVLIADGRITSVFCTATLGRGVNLPVRNVLVEGVRWEEEGDAMALRPLTREEFESLGGRAGRLGMSSGDGRAMVIRPAGAGEEELEDLLAESPMETARVRGGDETAEALFRSLYALGCAEEEQLSRFVSDGPFGVKMGREDVRGALASMADASLARPGRNGWQLSRVGAIAVAGGLSLEGASRVVEFLSSYDFESGSAADWFWEVCGLRETAANLPSASPHEAARLIEELGGQESVPVGEVLRFGLETQMLRRLKGTVALFLRFKGSREKEVESRAWVSAGIQQVLVRSADSITWTAKNIAQACGQAKAADFLHSIITCRAAGTEGGAPEAVELVIAGQGRDRSGEALVGGRKARLRLATYELLERLAQAGEEGEGWIRVSRLTHDGDAERARKYISQLRTELKPFVEFNPVENDGEGSYRLSRAFVLRRNRPGRKQPK